MLKHNNNYTPLAKLLGDHLEVPLWDNSVCRYVNLDNAATTPTFQSVWDALSAIMPWYGSIHRGAGYKSIVSTRLFEEALQKILAFSDANAKDDVLICSYNTTSCINHLERRLNLDDGSIVITSANEHSSNILPWRKRASNIECHATENGMLDLNHLEELLTKNHVNIVAVSAASNVTGAISDVHSIARLAHSHGAKIFVDASQIVAHRPLIRKSKDADDHLDYVAYSGHKMYAPFGLGVLVANKDIFRTGWPDVSGGGTIDLIDGNEIIWANLPSRESGGTPNFTGIIALAQACKALAEIGFEKIKIHEHNLIDHCKKHLATIENVTVHRSLDNDSDSLAIFPFSVSNTHHSLVGAYLGTEKGIGVRSGHLCQFSLVRSLLKITETERAKIKSEVLNKNKMNLYGLVRASCGIGTTTDDIEYLSYSLTDLIKNGTRAKYQQNSDGEFIAEGWTPPLPFSF